MKSKGFTLIELLVVVSIISLLSSVILASIRDARQKAEAKAFRQEIMQFVNAVELYRADNNGQLPTASGPQTTNFYYRKGGNGAESVTSGTVAQFKSVMAPYLSELPAHPTNTNTFTFSFAYALASTTNMFYKCQNDSEVPAYMIIINAASLTYTNQSLINTFSDWTPPVTSAGTEYISGLWKCYSL